MKFISTRGGDEPAAFSDMVLTGLARDGGLLLPETLPDVRDRLDAWQNMSYRDLAVAVLSDFAGDVPRETLRKWVRQAYDCFDHPEITPVRRIGPVYLLELFHGPTLAFKDLALQFLGQVFESVLEERDRKLNLVVATSGDTGSAAIHAVRGLPRVRVFVLYPRGRVSSVQERQMITVPDANVFALAVDGTFDDCQAIVKTLLGDLEFRDRYALGAVNSINFARVLAQIVYYFYAAFRVREQAGADRVCFSVPTGNFGDIFAGYLAWRMGLPINRLLLATNENDILARFFATGHYATTAVKATLSPSMDIQVASNFERYLYYLAAGDTDVVSRWMSDLAATGRLDLSGLHNKAGGSGVSGCDRNDVLPSDACVAYQGSEKRNRTDHVFLADSADRAATLAAIRRFAVEHDCVIDPHTAVGVDVALRHPDGATPTICLATAHPAKFPEAVREALGEDRARHPRIDALANLPKREHALPARAGAVADFLAARVAEQGDVS